jgi:hypothetical protein
VLCWTREGRDNQRSSMACVPAPGRQAGRHAGCGFFRDASGRLRVFFQGWWLPARARERGGVAGRSAARSARRTRQGVHVCACPVHVLKGLRTRQLKQWV